MKSDLNREVCKTRHCYGVVKEYELDGPREPPEYAMKQYNSPQMLIMRLWAKLLGREPPQLTWYECSLCHEPHQHLE